MSSDPVGELQAVIATQQDQINSLTRERDQLRDQVLRYTEIIGHLEEENKELKRTVYGLADNERYVKYGPVR